MTDYVQDTYTFTVSIIHHADLAISNVVVPSSVEENDPIPVTYDVTNSGAQDDCFGQIWDTDADDVVPGTRWDQIINAGGVKNVTTTIPGRTTDFSGTIQVGYTKP